MTLLWWVAGRGFRREDFGFWCGEGRTWAGLDDSLWGLGGLAVLDTIAAGWLWLGFGTGISYLINYEEFLCLRTSEKS